MLLPADSPRSGGVDPVHISLLAELDATELPPIVVHRSTMRIIDGMHRYLAAQRQGVTLIEVEFFDGTEEEAFVRSVELNVKQGLPLSLKDRKSAARRILQSSPSLSDRTVATSVGLSAKTVAAVRKQLEGDLGPATRVGSDGRRRPVNPEMGRSRARELLLQQPDMPLRSVAAAAGISVGTAHSVRKALREGEVVSAPEESARQPSTSLLEHDEFQSLLQKLRNDPSIRFSESGRRLILWLQDVAVHQSEIASMVDGLALHCMPTVAQLARHHAALWIAVAEKLRETQDNGNIELKSNSA
ncbi:ParB/RepB/Spo0J family partition protein [Nocardia nova]|nr:ParB N-terminal domain-containing protein [Nocardia nova]